MNEVSINKSMKLSPHFTLGELTKTSYYTTDGNIPSHEAIENLKRVCGWLEILRERYNKLYGDGASPPDPSYSGGEIPIVISSGYRSEEVNMKCGGAKGSNHLTGCAVDIRCYGPEQMIRYACLLLDIADEKLHSKNRFPSKARLPVAFPYCVNFDELILEKRGTTYWVHFAVRPKENRRKILFDCR